MGFAVDNLRSLRMPELVPLRRLMLVVGRNGTGKSTLLRCFPLLRQSMGRRTREPLLWWDDGGVDFDNFAEAVRRGAREISLGFRFQGPKAPWHVQVSIEGDEGRCWVASLRCSMGEGDDQLTLCFGPDGEVRSATGQLADAVFNAEDLLPLLQVEPWRLYGLSADSSPSSKVVEILKPFFHHLHGDSKKHQLADEVPWGSLDEVRRWAKEKLTYKKEDLTQDPIRSERLRRARFCAAAVACVVDTEGLLDDLAGRMAYLGPFRDMPKRSYRPHSLPVEQLDSNGANLAMFVAALSDAERSDLNQSLKDWLDFTLGVSSSGGSYRLNVTLHGQVFNLMDVGFGYSQVIPVVVQLWAAGVTLSASRDKRRLAMLAVEQPELHLHPHHQALVGRALAMAAARDAGPMLMVETHSEHLVSEVGMMVAQGILPRERVGVLCVEPHGEGGSTVREARFDEDGVLENWPAGFLSP